MQQQEDWYTGIDYYLDYKEKRIQAEEFYIECEMKKGLHENVELYFVERGEGKIDINGISYDIKKGSFLCLYMHHFYRIHSVISPLRGKKLSFYIGNFMTSCFGKNPKYINSMLVYDTCPLVDLKQEKEHYICGLMRCLFQEQKEERFGATNMIAYLAMQIHMLHCRYALENIKESKNECPVIWKLIPRIILSSSKVITLDELAKSERLSPAYLNQMLKRTCGYTFFQLQKYGKIINACALMHFPELSLSYISDLLGFSNIQDFCRVFKMYVHKSPKEYQEEYIGSGKEESFWGGSALSFIQYMHLNFMKKISPETMAEFFHMKVYTVKSIFREVYEISFYEMLEQIRIQYACAYLLADSCSITEVSNRCGFENLSTFQRAFYKYCSETPTQFRKHNI